MNRGAEKFSALDLSLAEITKALKAIDFAVRPSTLSEWRKGKKAPRPAARRKLQEAFGIPTVDWDELVALEGGDGAPQPIELPAIAPNTGKTSLDPPASELAKDLLGRIQALREQSELTTLPLSARKQLAEMEGRAIERYAKLSGQAATERDILSSPHFMRVLDELMAALERFPEALRAVRKAMSESDAA